MGRGETIRIVNGVIVTQNEIENEKSGVIMGKISNKNLFKFCQFEIIRI